MIAREANFIDAFQTRSSPRPSSLLAAGSWSCPGCCPRAASWAPLAGLERRHEVYVAVDPPLGETLETHQVAVQRMVQAGVVPVTWLSLASQYEGSYQPPDSSGIPGPDGPPLAGTRNALPSPGSPAAS